MRCGRAGVARRVAARGGARAHQPAPTGEPPRASSGESTPPAGAAGRGRAPLPLPLLRELDELLRALPWLLDSAPRYAAPELWRALTAALLRLLAPEPARAADADAADSADPLRAEGPDDPARSTRALQVRGEGRALERGFGGSVERRESKRRALF